MSSRLAFGRALAAVVAVAMVLAGCGGEDTEAPADVLGQADEALGEVRSGGLSLRLAASTADSGPVGFALEGRFSFDRDEGDDLPVLDLTYTRLLGDGQAVTTFRSTGREAFVTADGETYQVPDARLDSLRDSTGAGLGSLGLTDWIRSPEAAEGREVDGVGTQRLTGDLAVGALFDDLAAVDARLGGGAGLPALDAAATERLEALVRSSAVELLVGGEDGVPRRFAASADLDGRVPAELQEALGRAAGFRLEVTFGLSDPGSDVVVAVPTETLPLPPP